MGFVRVTTRIMWCKKGRYNQPKVLNFKWQITQKNLLLFRAGYVLPGDDTTTQLINAWSFLYQDFPDHNFRCGSFVHTTADFYPFSRENKQFAD